MLAYIKIFPIQEHAMSAYQTLVNIYEKINHFSHISSICHWDQAAMMPSGGNHARSEAMATLSVHIHQLSTDPKIATLIQQAHQEDLTDEARASLREMERSYSLSTVLPDDFVAKKSSLAQPANMLGVNNVHAMIGKVFSKLQARRPSCSRRSQNSGRKNRIKPLRCHARYLRTGNDLRERLDQIFLKLKPDYQSSPTKSSTRKHKIQPRFLRIYFQ